MNIKNNMATFLLISTALTSDAVPQNQEDRNENFIIDIPISIKGCTADNHEVTMTLHSNLELNIAGNLRQQNQVSNSVATSVLYLGTKFQEAIGDKGVKEVINIASKFNYLTDKNDALGKIVSEEIPYLQGGIRQLITNIDSDAHINDNFKLRGMSFSMTPSDSCYAQLPNDNESLSY